MTTRTRDTAAPKSYVRQRSPITLAIPGDILASLAGPRALPAAVLAAKIEGWQQRALEALQATGIRRLSGTWRACVTLRRPLPHTGGNLHNVAHLVLCRLARIEIDLVRVEVNEDEEPAMLVTLEQSE